MDELRTDDPRWIGEYRLLGRLGSGGMGRVYLARSHRGRTVAVKLVRAELAAQDEFRTRFRREVLAARRVGGAWTAPVLDADTEAEVPWVATGYVAGPSLHEVVGKGGYGPLPERSVRVLAQGLARALMDIHAAGLVHRDLKPSNVMITIDGPRVIDFGIARALETVADGALTYTGAMIGSPAFMSPEQVRGDRVTPACDVFCLGSVLAYAATGLQPFGAASSGVHAQMYRIVQEPPDLETVPEGLRDLVADCLAKAPEDRPSAAGVLELLGPADGEPPSDGEPWLPGAIVAQLGRQVVRLLELEAAETGSLPVVPAPVRTESQARVGPAAGAEAARAEAARVEAARTEVARAEAARAEAVRAKAARAEAARAEAAPAGTVRTAAAPTVAREEPPAGRAASPRQPAWANAHASQLDTYRSQTLPQAPADGSAQGSGTGTAEGSEPRAAAGAPEPPRKRRGALVALLVVLGVIAGAATAYVALHAREHAASGASPGPKKHVAATADSSTPATHPTVATGALPGGMVGTWRATFDDVNGNESTRTLEVDGDGSVVLTGDGKDPDGQEFTCSWTMRVTAAQPQVSLGPSQVASGPSTSCEPGTASTLTLVDTDHLRRVNVNGQQLTYRKM